MAVVQLEVEFDSFSQLEGFWGSIPPVEHKAWSQRVQVASCFFQTFFIFGLMFSCGTPLAYRLSFAKASGTIQ